MHNYIVLENVKTYIKMLLYVSV